MTHTTLLIAFGLVIVLMALWDLGFLSKDHHISHSQRSALFKTCAWGFWATLYGISIYFTSGIEKASEFFACYLIELSLSIDNVFVFIMLFKSFKVNIDSQHRVLLYGVVSAIIMRLMMISGGVYVIQHFNFIMLIFGGILLYSGYKMFYHSHTEFNFTDHTVVKFLRKYVNVSDTYKGDRFYIRQNNKLVFTPLVLVLVLVEITDLIFAVDSIPVALSITQDVLIVFTSNVFAIFCLRSLYFLIMNIMSRFQYLHYGISIILIYVGLKIILGYYAFHIPIYLTLSFIVLCLGSTAAISILKR